jgi:hypothetical protein
LDYLKDPFAMDYKRTDFFDELEVTAELLADGLASRIRRSGQRPDAQPGNFGAVFG